MYGITLIIGKNTANNTGGITNVYSAGSIGGLDAATENVSTYW